MFARKCILSLTVHQTHRFDTDSARRLTNAATVAFAGSTTGDHLELRSQFGR